MERWRLLKRKMRKKKLRMGSRRTKKRKNSKSKRRKRRNKRKRAPRHRPKRTASTKPKMAKLPTTKPKMPKKPKNDPLSTVVQPNPYISLIIFNNQLLYLLVDLLPLELRLLQYFVSQLQHLNLGFLAYDSNHTQIRFTPTESLSDSDRPLYFALEPVNNYELLLDKACYFATVVDPGPLVTFLNALKMLTLVFHVNSTVAVTSVRDEKSVSVV